MPVLPECTTAYLLSLVLALLAPPATFEAYPARPAVCVRVIDGDTAVFRISLDYDVFIEQSIRLEGFNAPELRGPNGALARAAKERLDAHLMGRPAWVRRTGPRTFARYVGRVYVTTSGGTADLSELMAREGFSVPQGD